MAKRAGSSIPIVDHSDQDSRAVCGENATCVGCRGTMLDKPRIRAFARLVKQHDVPVTEEGIIELVMHGKP